MGFYDDEKTAGEYIAMAEGYDGRELIDILRQHVTEGARVLELGMGPGVDLNILKNYFQVTGSDNSTFFLDRYRALDSEADLMQLDAATLVTDRVFDCIYSNKVLHHLTDDELASSFSRQKAILSDKGFIMHSFWRGTDSEEHHGLRFLKQTEDSIRAVLGREFKLVDVVVYSEMENDDSLFILARV